MAKHIHSRLATLTYLVFFLPKLVEHNKEDGFVKYHEQQAIGLLIFAFFLQGIISFIGYWGLDPWGIRVWPVRFILLYELWVGMRNACYGERKELPWIGKYATKLFS